MQGRILLTTFLLAIAPVADAAEPPAPPSPEENILRTAGVAADGAGLLTFFRQHTLSNEETKKIGQLVGQLGADDFDDRQRAYEALKKIGSRILPLVRPAAHGADVETARSAERLLKEVDPPPQLPAVAAARLLARRAPAGAVPALLDYLPFADNGAVEDEVRAALTTLTPDGKADPALAAALDDAQPIRRAAAAYVLGRKGDAAQREAVRKRLQDADAGVRWQAAAALLAAHDRAAMPALMDLLADGPFDTAWRAEELLRRLAGDKGPAATLDDAPENRRKCRDAWAAWWKDKGDGVDLASYKEPERLLGYTLGVEYNTGRVWECEIDGSLRWEIRDLAGPMDAQVLPNGRVLIAEADTHRVTERDFKGKVLWEQKIDGEPNGCQRLANGNTFVSTYNPTTMIAGSSRAMEFRPDGTRIYYIKLENGGADSDAVRKDRDGHICYTWSHGMTEVDKSGKIVRVAQLPAGAVLYVCVDDLPGGRFLVADSRGGQVLEVNAEKFDGKSDMPAVKILWEAHIPSACGATRLPNGHTLIGANHKVVELGRDGKPVWEKDADGYVRRVYRR